VIKKLVHIEHDIEKPIWLENLGDYNTLPDPCVQCSQEEFLNYMLSESIIMEEFRQVRLVKDNYMAALYNARIFWYFGCGYIVIRKWVTNKEWHEFYRLGCNHEWAPLGEEDWKKRRGCFHVDRCSKCGMIQEYDSSD
jgi:hypothetical protein